jgi:hypothetical protein
MAYHRGSDLHAEGHEIAETGAGIKHAPDCPKCKVGTLVCHISIASLECIDCGAVFTVQELIDAHVVRRVAR